MKHLLVITLIFVTGGLFAQSKSVDAFRALYQDDENAKVVSISGSLFQLVSNLADEVEDDEDVQAMARIAKNIQAMNVLSVPLYKSGLKPEDVTKLRNDIMNEKYDELFQARDGDDKVYFLAQGKKNEVRNMLVLITSDDEFVLMNIDGVLDMKDLALMAKNHHNWD